MRRRRRKDQISTRTAVILAGSAVAGVLLIGFIFIVTSGKPMARRLPPPPPRNADEAWQSLVGTWTHTVQSPNTKAVSTYRFTADRKFVRSSTVTGGVLPMPMTNETTMPVQMVEVFDDEIHLTLGPGQTVAFLFTGPNTIALLTDDDEIEYTREK